MCGNLKLIKRNLTSSKTRTMKRQRDKASRIAVANSGEEEVEFSYYGFV